MWQCFLPITGEAGLVVLDHFFRMLILYMLLTLLRHYGWEKLQCSECFRLQNIPILSGMVIFQNWGAPLIFGATSTLNWTWKSSSLEINYFGRFLLRQKNDQNQPNMTMAVAQTKGVPSPMESLHTQSYHRINRDTGTYSYVHIAYKILWQRKHKTYCAE